MSTFYPFGIPSTSSFAISASNANKIVNPNYTAPLAEYALYAPPGTRGIDATTCPPGFRNAYSPGGGFTPIPSNPNVLNRSQYLLCFGEPSPTPTPSITPTHTITPSATPGATPSQSPTPSPTRTPPTTPQATVSMTPTVTPSRSLIPTIQLTIGGNIVGGFPDFWIVKSNVAVPVNVVVAAGSPEFKGYFGTDAETLANCTNGDPVETGDTFPGATLLQNTTSITAAGPGEIGTPITWRNSSVAFIDTNDGNGSQLRTTGATWTDANNYTWSLTITDQTCSTSYPT